MLKKQLSVLMNLVTNELDDVLAQALTSVDLTTLGEKILNKEPIDGMTVEEVLFDILTIAQYVETETMLESPISDELYDKLHAKYVEITGHSIVGTNNTSGSNKPTKQHKYPELRGSLGKVHFIHSKDIPEKDSRKSLEDFFKRVDDKCHIGYTKIPMSFGLKYDGLSAVFECNGNVISDVVTRKDVDNNIGVVINHVFSELNVIDVMGKNMPRISDVIDELDKLNNTEYGIKTEILMSEKDFEEFKTVVPVAPNNRRSAVSMILNTSKDEFNPEWTKYLTVQPLQLATSVELESTYDTIIPIGECNGRFQYMLNFPNIKYDENVYDLMDIAESIEIDNIKSYANDIGLPIDGMVCTILDPSIIRTMGRKDNINQFQIAYKFPAGIVKTTLLDVEFQVGPVAGTITPVAKIKPIVIMGNTITSPGLSNLGKLKRLDLNIGDEVYVKYDIVPTLFKTDDCKKGTGKHIDTITKCPICNSDLDITDDYSQARCVNQNCPCRTSGRIYNFINKVGIEGIGMPTINVLVERGFLKTPADLYRLAEHRNELITIPGFGDRSVDTMIKAIMTKRRLYMHELLGSIGIPDIGRRIMKRIADAHIVDMNDLIHADVDDDVFKKLFTIKGIGPNNVIKIINGLDYNRPLIDDLLHYIGIIPYEDTSNTCNETVLFTKVRDPKFAEYLVSNHLANVADNYNKNVTIVIVPNMNVTSSKVTKALKDNKTIMTIDEAYKFFA